MYFVLEGLFDLFVTLSSLVLNLPLALYYRWFDQREFVKRTNSDTLTIFLHGRGATFHQFIYLFSFTEGSIYAPLLRGETIEDDVEHIHAFVSGLDVDTVNMIGVSRGGIVALAYANRYKVNKVTTLSSPLKGTRMTVFSCDSTTKMELGYQSPYLLELEKETRINVENKKYALHSIYPLFDHVIQPTSSCRYEWNTNNTFVPSFYDHTSITFDERITQYI
jgi:pimeloyl-ACP methyl ester carboxylesterase